MRLLLALFFCGVPARAAVPETLESPTLRVLQGEAAKDPAGQGSPEAAKGEAGKTFTGEKDQPAATGPGEAAPVAETGADSYHFVGTAPMKGVNIYSPVADKNGEGHTSKPKPEPLVKPWIVGALLGGGLLATGGGIAALAAAGPVGWSILGGVLLFLGGAAIAAGIIGLVLNKKAGASD